MSLPCFVYASRNRPDTYLWLVRRDDFAVLPAALRTTLGTLRLTLELDLDASRRLPHAEAATVMAQLRAQGWFLQLPPAGALASSHRPNHGARLPDTSDR